MTQAVVASAGGRMDGPTQKVAVGAASVTITNAFAAETCILRVVADVPCNYRVYDLTGTATATTADPFLPGLWVEYILVRPGQKLSVIQAATEGLVTAGTGNIWVTELN